MKKTMLLSAVIASAMNVFCQSDVAGFFGHQRTNIRFVGWSPGLLSVAGSLDIRNDFANQPVNFFAGGNTAAFQRMTILGTTGFVGVGTAAPTQRLEVDAGNVNIFTNTNAYMLGSQNMLWHKGKI